MFGFYYTNNFTNIHMKNLKNIRAENRNYLKTTSCETLNTTVATLFKILRLLVAFYNNISTSTNIFIYSKW